MSNIQFRTGNGAAFARRPRGLQRTAAVFAYGMIAMVTAAALLAKAGPLSFAGVDRMTTSAYSSGGADAGALRPRAMPVCGYEKRVNCVVDGDTLWLDGEKIRIANIDAPEVRARCDREKRLAREATLRLAGLLRGRPLRVAAQGTDRFGRTIAAVATDAGDVGDALVREKLAVAWRGRREPVSTWCGL